MMPPSRDFREETHALEVLRCQALCVEKWWGYKQTHVLMAGTQGCPRCSGGPQGPCVGIARVPIFTDEETEEEQLSPSRKAAGEVDDGSQAAPQRSPCAQPLLSGSLRPAESEKQRTRDRAPGEGGCVRAEKDPGGEKHLERKKRCALQAKGGEQVWRCGPGQLRSAPEGAKAPYEDPHQTEG